MIYTTFEQTDYGFVLLDINKKQSDKNWFWKVKNFQIWAPEDDHSVNITKKSYLWVSDLSLIKYYIFNYDSIV